MTRPPTNRKTPIPGVRKTPVPALPVAQSAAHVARKDGRTLKRMTLYLPSDLAKRLAIHCAEHDVDMSAVVTEAVRLHLPSR